MEIKANFLGLTKEINGVANTEVDLSKKWVATISTHVQWNSVMFRNLDSMEMLLQKIWIDKSELLQKAKVSEKQTGLMYTLLEWENQHGMYQHLLSEVWLIAKTVHPVVSTMLPKISLETSYRFGVA